MEQWHFYGEREQDGLTFLLGRQENDATIYRWEPLIVTPKGRQISEFCQTLKQRRQVLTVCHNQALLPVFGPIRHENRWWVGWQDLAGRNPFSVPDDQDQLTDIIRALLPLIRAYEVVHLTGLCIGAPDWHRITRNSTGFHLPDPWLKEYLDHPKYGKVPSGLSTIYPPELSRDASLSQAGDRFYLGLLLYSIICGKLPYPLKNHWPQGIDSGRLIPLNLRQPHLNPEFCEVVTDLLAVDPEERPLLHETRLRWQNSLAGEAFLASNRDHAINLQQFHYYSMRLWLHNWLSRFKIPLGISVAFWLLFTGSSWWRNRPGPDADQIVQELFQAPFTATALLDPNGCNDLISRLNAEKKRRSELVKQLTTKPYVKVKSHKYLKRSPQETSLLLTLEWSIWEKGQWHKIVSREKILLNKNHRTWKIRKTHAVSQTER